ncbi:hypothetical protein RUND412_009485 [Rhizina undulata]
MDHINSLNDYLNDINEFLFWKPIENQTGDVFFARHVKPEQCDPDDPKNPEVIVSAADSVFDGSWDVNKDNNVIFAKGIRWNIQFLLDGCEYAESFKGGKFMHAFLNAIDYHRQHATIMGKILEAKVIPGAAYLQVVPVADPTSTQEKTDNPSAPFKGVEAPDNPGYQFLQARACIIIDSPIGLVGVLPIGMAQVSSVKLSAKAGDYVEKRQEISCFQFGGSDIVLVF